MNPTDVADPTVVVVGGGQGGFQAAASLRDHGYAGRVLLISDEPGVPYQRPPLSKAYLSGSSPPLSLRPASFYQRNRIELMHGRAVAIDRADRRVRLRDGRSFRYDQLVLALGASPRLLPVPGIGWTGVHMLRTREDADRLVRQLEAAERLVVVGAGVVGMEFAAAVRKRGLDVTVVEAGDRPMARLVSPEVSSHLRDLHDHHGVRFLFNRTVRALHGGETGQVESVETDDGERLPADLVLVATGVVPDVDLARSSGLEVADGIVVDERLITSDPDISALGDCANFPTPRSGVRGRLESVQNAVDQARCIAARIAGEDGAYDRLPWFWSEQFGARLQIAGLSGGADQRLVKMGDKEGSFSVYSYRDGQFLAVESVNRPSDHLNARRLLEARLNVPVADVAVGDFDLGRFVRA